MSEPGSTLPPEELLPGSYDELVGIERLQHGEHNPRQVRPQKELIESIKRDGLQQPLVVRPATDGDRYYITDGWQRYQAAIRVGWEQLPVKIYSTPLEALEAAETASIVREWSVYNWARHCQSVATEVEASNPSDRAKTVAEHVTKSWRTVARYLAVLELPEVIHPLLYDGPGGSEEDWDALQNHNDRVKEYGSLPWEVAEPLGRAYRQETIGSTRAIGLAAKAVIYDREIAEDLIARGIENPSEPLSAVEQFARQYSDGSPDLWVPRTTVCMPEPHRAAIIKYCAEEYTSIPTLVSELLEQFAEDVAMKDE